MFGHPGLCKNIAYRPSFVFEAKLKLVTCNKVFAYQRMPFALVSRNKQLFIFVYEPSGAHEIKFIQIIYWIIATEMGFSSHIIKNK